MYIKINQPAGQESLRTLELVLTDINNPTNRFIDKCEHKYLFRDMQQISKLQASTKSSLIECSYSLVVSTEYESCMCCSSAPRIDIPIIIYIPEIKYFDETVRPLNWNPEVMPIYQMNLNNGGMGIDINQNMNNTGMMNSGYGEIQKESDSNQLKRNEF